MATSTFGSSPGVKMSWLLKFNWKELTPGNEPAGARISAGKSGKVLMSFPNRAVVRVNWPPVSCMPSPESPARRITTDSSSSTGLSSVSCDVMLGSPVQEDGYIGVGLLGNSNPL